MLIKVQNPVEILIFSNTDYFKSPEFALLSFPCNQFSNQMPEADGEEMVCHLRQSNADLGDVFAKVKIDNFSDM
jgi:glutathione peroxidase-family protein